MSPKTKTPESESKLGQIVMQAILNITSWHPEVTDAVLSKELADSHGADEGIFLTKKKLIRDVLLGGKKRRTSWDQLNAARRKLRSKHKHWTLPWLGKGVGLLPCAFYFEYQEDMDKCEGEYMSALNVFIHEFVDLRDDAIRAANGTLKLEEYPDEADLLALFQVNRDILPLPTHFVDTPNISSKMPVGAQKIEAELQKLQNGAEASINARLGAASQGIFRRFKEMIGRMIETLNNFKTDPETGKIVKGKFHDTMIKNIEELVAMVPDFNFLNDPAITAFAEDVKLHLCVAPEVLKSDDMARAETLKQAERIYKKMSNYL